MEPREDLPLGAIAELCRAHRVVELLVFGSYLRDDFRPDSDIDFLVVFEPGTEKPARGHVLALEEDLTRLLGRQSDLVSKRAVEEAADLERRDRILGAARRVYPD